MRSASVNFTCVRLYRARRMFSYCLRTSSVEVSRSVFPMFIEVDYFHIRQSITHNDRQSKNNLRTLHCMCSVQYPLQLAATQMSSDSFADHADVPFSCGIRSYIYIYTHICGIMRYPQRYTYEYMMYMRHSQNQSCMHVAVSALF